MIYQNSNTDYEIDFLPVGSGEQSGDAICLRWGNLYGKREEQTVVVIDGGFKESGEKMVAHIGQHYKTDKVDLMISTHPDLDHSSGLRTILNEMQVRSIWMHLPWIHTKEMAEEIEDGRVTSNSLKKDLKESLSIAWEIKKIAEEKNIEIIEPFKNTFFENNGGRLEVLNPSKEDYESLLPFFREMPNEKAQASHFSKNTDQKVYDYWENETLQENPITSAENESSVVLLFTIQNKHFLFTGDAGEKSLKKACNILDPYGLLQNFTLIQAPHHGSKNNVSPSLLDQLVGPKNSWHDHFHKTIKSWMNNTSTHIIFSASEKSLEHPSQEVLNAFIRRGGRCFFTKNGGYLYQSAYAPQRIGWISATHEHFQSGIVSK